MTSTVVPSNIVMMSLGRWASAPGMFSASASQAVTRIGNVRRAAATTAPNTVAAPAMSDFISGMEAAGLRDRPPESKVMPLPMSATCLGRAASLSPSDRIPLVFSPFCEGTHSKRTRRAGCTEPWATPRIPPNPCSTSIGVSHTSTVIPASCPAEHALSANTSGVRRLGGSLTRSRVRVVASTSARASDKTAFPSGVSDRDETMKMLFRAGASSEEDARAGRSSFLAAFQE